MTPSDYAARLREFARQVGNLPLADHRAPEVPHLMRSELRHSMMTCAAEWDARRPEPAPPRLPFQPGLVTADGRIVPVQVRRRRTAAA